MTTDKILERAGDFPLLFFLFLPIETYIYLSREEIAKKHRKWSKIKRKKCCKLLIFFYKNGIINRIIYVGVLRLSQGEKYGDLTEASNVFRHGGAEQSVIIKIERIVDV